MTCLKTIAPVLFLASIAFNSHAQDINYSDLGAQDRADLARYLGWVWGDGRPGFDGNGILYKGGNSNYKAVVSRLAQINIDGTKNPFGFPESGDRKLTRVWSYWENSLPGGNPGDPLILREAIKHPNFLAGIIEGEGQIFHSDANKDFYIADQSYAPSHPDKLYDIANFGPERMIQLFYLLEETYGFTNPAMSIKRTKYQFNTQRREVVEKLRTKYKELKEQNERGNLQSGFSVKIYINPPNFDEIRNYGYFKKDSGKYRTPAPDRLLKIITTSRPDQNSEVLGTTTFFDDDFNDNVGNDETCLLHDSGLNLSSNLDMVSIRNNEGAYWTLIELDNGFYRIEYQDSTNTTKRMQALNNARLRVADERYSWHQTQWEKIPVANTNNRIYLKNRYFGSYLQVDALQSTVIHSARNAAAQWKLPEVDACVR